MHFILIVLTSLLIAIAGALSVVIARLLREDRQRSDARVAALAMMAGAAEPDSDPEFGSEPVPAWRDRAEPAAGRGFAEQGAAEPLSGWGSRSADADDAPALFAPPAPESPWARRFAVIGTLSAVFAAVLLSATYGGRHTARGPEGSPAGVETSNGAPLELLDLQHARESQRLTISGVVRNPAGAAPRSHLVATAIVFGPDGKFLTSSRAPVDLANVGPGQESKFTIAIPLNGEVSRYRIGFRSDDGTVVAHVDKRTTATFARKQEQP
jgi:hypothetical protein